ncbi:hypothetical protein ACFZAG_10030 [Streptomyces sp. NPDC012403]|uniref:hypothetical protein n=1 Tax=unclassified Streptomyces TaxID=2593676 RepID=UPI0036EEF89A
MAEAACGEERTENAGGRKRQQATPPNLDPRGAPRASRDSGRFGTGFAGWLDQAMHAVTDLDSEVVDPSTGEAIAIATAYWPHGLQEEVGGSVVLAIDTTPAEQAAMEASDYRVFHSADALRRYVRNMRAEHAST